MLGIVNTCPECVKMLVMTGFYSFMVEEYSIFHMFCLALF